MTADATGEALARVFREEAGLLTGALTRLTGDFALAEECVQDAVVRALERWPRDGLPERPGAWLHTVARNRALDRLRRAGRERRLLELAAPVRPEPDDRLRTIFTCCHPSLAPEAQLALTLQAVCGFSTAQIAGALLSSPDAVSQRVSRARRKIAAAGVPLEMPQAADLDARRASVHAVLYLMFNEGYLSSGSRAPAARDLCEDAAWLAGVLAELYPRDGESLGLLALMRLHLARAASRFDERGEIVLLADQDRSRWDRQAIAAAVALLERAARLGPPGRYQLQAAIVACHAEADGVDDTDWPQIVVLYDLLLAVDPSPVVRLNRAVALRSVRGAEAALAEVEAVAPVLAGYHLLHAVRGELLRELGRRADAEAAGRRALELTENAAERALLAARLGQPS